MDCIGRPLLEMQVGHGEKATGRPMERSRRQGLQMLTRALEFETVHGGITMRAPVSASDRISGISALATISPRPQPEPRPVDAIAAPRSHAMSSPVRLTFRDALRKVA